MAQKWQNIIYFTGESSTSFASLSLKHHINGLSPQPTQIPDTQGLAWMHRPHSKYTK